MNSEAPIIRLFFAKMKTAFFELSEAERAAFMAKDRANLDSLGMKAVSMIDCSSTDEKWDHIGVERWPSMAAVKQREAFENEELHISEYVDYEVHMGVEQSFENYGK